MIELTEQQWKAITSEDPPCVVAPDSKETLVLVRQETYLQMKALLEDNRDIRGAYPLLDAIGAMEGWNDPAMDIYNDIMSA
jgi:hypothetical protein